jgi:hypothetical protein
MSDTKPFPETPLPLKVELYQPPVAAILAWLCPGLGHFYQGRNAKGALFFVCILSTWFFGLWLGGGHSVYASNTTIARKLVFGCQLGVGLPAAPAIIQGLKASKNQQPLWEGFMAPPKEGNGFDDLSDWNFQFGAAYDLGVLYTMIAGLLNILVIFDAFAGPMPVLTDEERKLLKEAAKTKVKSPPST